VQPRPRRPIPLWIGGQSDAAVRRTAAIGDGWLGSFASPDKAGAAKRDIQAALAENGRVIEDDHYGMSLPMRLGDADDPAVAAARKRLAERLPPDQRGALEDSFAAGPVDEVIALLRRYVAAGMSKFVLLPLVSDAAGLMQQTRLLLDHVIPAIEDRAPAAA
jgi:alkanesulfonate monooxygenase SsuD/methylene tetrahydromethanopterin reductase-like flavin-dependent oxidoreductase (luciferase family)